MIIVNGGEETAINRTSNCKVVEMAKSLRSKRDKRLRAIRREIVQPFYDKKDAAKQAAQEAALAAPKLPVRSAVSQAMDISASATASTSNDSMDVDTAVGNQSTESLKAVGGVGKKSKRKFKLAKRRLHGKGKIGRRHI
ncbi:hypothetical protein Nepgr_032878 [Nepenthes gracilis]|uniref:Uncharacterized protein n=1 Tax=Nepenthes gracilis TaxID=150966 RepID=A0AAD3Y803_NEPGR|nr:hypothetical protein Nepgr_032878 [Nepenthes gracilis]